MSFIVDLHRQYLSDQVRVEAFAAAIAATVRPGDVVADIGSGSGILGLLALRAGAARVYAIEGDGSIELARAIAADNGVSSRFTFIHGVSSHVDLPERADVIVADLIGHMGFEPGLFEVYADARRWLKPGARAIPSAITVHAAPVQHAEAHGNIAAWQTPVSGFRTDAVLRWALNTGYPLRLDDEHLLSSSSAAAAFPTLDAPALLRIAGDVAITRGGVMHGIGAWFTAAMAPGVTMTNAPGAASRINRRNVFLPLERPLAVAAGDTVRVSLAIRPEDTLVRWAVDARTASGTRHERHSTLEGMLLTREELRAHDPQWRPRLTPRGAARHTLLALCDGRHALAEIEQEMRRRHPALFATEAQVEAFVAEVVTRYGAFDET